MDSLQSFKEIAEWFAEHRGRFDAADPNPAYDILLRDFLDGDFEEGGRSKVIYLHHYTRMTRLTRQRLLDAP
jgi:hypothetical protein